METIPWVLSHQNIPYMEERDYKLNLYFCKIYLLFMYEGFVYQMFSMKTLD